MKTNFTILLLSLWMISCDQNENKEIKTGIVKNTSYTDYKGEKVMQIETIVSGSIEDVWKLHTTNEGLKTFMAPVIDVEIKINGKWEASYDLNAKIGDSTNIINRVICYIPNEMLVIKTERAPKGYANPEILNSMVTILKLEEVDQYHTKIIETTVGWKNNREYNSLWKPSLEANKMLLNLLNTSLETKKPTDWKKICK